MLRPRSIALALALCAGASACSKEPKAKTAAPEQAPLPAITLPASIPVDAAGILVLRSAESFFATLASLDLLGPASPENVDAMRTELDEFMQSRLGMTLTTAHLAVAFYTADEGVAVVVQGTEGSLRGTPDGELHGVEIHVIDGLSVAKHEGELIVGSRSAVELAISTLAGGRPALRDSKSPLRTMVLDRSEGVLMMAAVDTSQPPFRVPGPARSLGIEQAMLSYGNAGVEAVIEGDPEGLATLQAEAVAALDAITMQTEAQYEQAMRGGSVWTGIGSIVTYHQWQQVRGRLVPRLQGRRLSLLVPVTIHDPDVLAALAGVAAAIAVPALDKYMKRSKTSEPRVEVAKMFDATAAFFYEEQLPVSGTEGSSDPIHRCPSDGRLIGSAGPTPPLSLNCNDGPDGYCVPVRGTPEGPGEYSVDLWLKNPVWQEMNVVKEQPHRFHLDFRWNNSEQGYGTCQFTAQAFGDLDDDGVFSTFERAGAGDHNGMNSAAGMYIDRELD
ncbi:MAG: hypothetical protein AAF799_07575 [Myxococcota bacterium]